MIKTLAIAAALVGGALVAAPAGAAPLGAAAGPVASSAQTGNDLVETVQYRRYGYGRGYYGPRYGYRGGYYRGGRGAAVGAGVAAGAVGALAAGALVARPYYAEPAPVYVAPPRSTTRPMPMRSPIARAASAATTPRPAPISPPAAWFAPAPERHRGFRKDLPAAMRGGFLWLAKPRSHSTALFLHHLFESWHPLFGGGLRLQAESRRRVS